MRSTPAISQIPRAVTAALCSILPLSFGCVGPRVDSHQDADRAQVRADLTLLQDALDKFAQLNAGRYPDSLEVLVIPDQTGARYIDRVELPRDPWQRDYVYVTSNRPTVKTLGRDGVEGGQGPDADLDLAALTTEP